MHSKIISMKLVIPSIILQIIDLYWVDWKYDYLYAQMKIGIINWVLVFFIIKNFNISLLLIVFITIAWNIIYILKFYNGMIYNIEFGFQLIILQSLFAYFINEENNEYHINLTKFYQSEHNWNIIQNSVAENLEESMGLSSLHSKVLQYSDICDLFTTYIQWAKSIVRNFPAGIMFYSLEKGCFYTNKLLQSMDL